MDEESLTRKVQRNIIRIKTASLIGYCSLCLGYGFKSGDWGTGGIEQEILTERGIVTSPSFLSIPKADGTGGIVQTADPEMGNYPFTKYLQGNQVCFVSHYAEFRNESHHHYHVLTMGPKNNNPRRLHELITMLIAQRNNGNRPAEMVEKPHDVTKQLLKYALDQYSTSVPCPIQSGWELD